MVGIAQDEVEVVCECPSLDVAAVAFTPPVPGTEIPSTSRDMLRSEIKLWMTRR